MPNIIAAKYRDGGEFPIIDEVPPFDKVKVKYAIHGMRNGKTQNPTRIKIEVLKIFYAIIQKKLKDLFNVGYDSFSGVWKIDLVHALLKNTNKNDSTSYRPICLLPMKCLEKLLIYR